MLLIATEIFNYLIKTYFPLNMIEKERLIVRLNFVCFYKNYRINLIPNSIKVLTSLNVKGQFKNNANNFYYLIFKLTKFFANLQ